MREKRLYLVITFHTTSAAMAMEALCMSFRAEVEQEQALLAAAAEAGIQVDGAYKLWL